MLSAEPQGVGAGAHFASRARGILPILIAVPIIAIVQWVIGEMPFVIYISSIVGVNLILAVSLNIVNGMTGQFSIGHAGFMAVGAYISGKFSLEIKDLMIAQLPASVSDQLTFLGALLMDSAKLSASSSKTPRPSGAHSGWRASPSARPSSWCGSGLS